MSRATLFRMWVRVKKSQQDLVKDVLNLYESYVRLEVDNQRLKNQFPFPSRLKYEFQRPVRVKFEFVSQSQLSNPENE